MTTSTTETQDQDQVQITEVTLPGDVFGFVYNYLQSKPAAETRQVLNALDKIVEQLVEAKKASLVQEQAQEG